jgi:hypothetical protein
MLDKKKQLARSKVWYLLASHCLAGDNHRWWLLVVNARSLESVAARAASRLNVNRSGPEEITKTQQLKQLVSAIEKLLFRCIHQATNTTTSRVD